MCIYLVRRCRGVWLVTNINPSGADQKGAVTVPGRFKEEEEGCRGDGSGEWSLYIKI